MEAITLVDLAAVIGAVLGPMLLLMGAMMRYQHVDSVKTRDLIEESNRENRELIGQARRENREQIGGLRAETRELIDQVRRENREQIGGLRAENRELIGGLRGELRELGRSVADARERLARIEGHLGVPSPPPQIDDGDNAEAA